MEVPKINWNRYFHEDHLEGIINPKIQLSSGWRDIADFEMYRIQTKTLQTRIWICYILLDFYATELSEIASLGVKILSCHLIFRLHFPKKHFFFLQEPYIIVNVHLSNYQTWKILWDISNNTEKINLSSLVSWA